MSSLTQHGLSVVDTGIPVLLLPKLQAGQHGERNSVSLEESKGREQETLKDNLGNSPG